jgi:hypothetical protein
VAEDRRAGLAVGSPAADERQLAESTERRDEYVEAAGRAQGEHGRRRLRRSFAARQLHRDHPLTDVLDDVGDDRRRAESLALSPRAHAVERTELPVHAARAGEMVEQVGATGDLRAGSGDQDGVGSARRHPLCRAWPLLDVRVGRRLRLDAGRLLQPTLQAPVPCREVGALPAERRRRERADDVEPGRREAAVPALLKVLAA